MSDLTVFISADLEGISGWIGEDESTPATREAMVSDVNAAIEGVRQIVPDPDVLVADAHGDKQTIPPTDLDESASLLRGDTRPYGMVDGVDGDTDLAFFIGYHGRPGSGGFLEHTFTGSIADVRLDGDSVGEVELNATLLADRDVPVTLVTGDDYLRETVAERLPQAEYVTTKTARSSTSAIGRHPTAVKADIRDAAAAAATDLPAQATPPVSVDPPMTVTVDFVRADLADLAALWPGVKKTDDSRTIAYEAPTVSEAFQFVRGAATVRPADQ